jgi:hypothetical protein
VRLFEKDRSDAARLGEVAAEYAAKGLTVTAAQGDITSLLEPTVNSAAGYRCSFSSTRAVRTCPSMS